MSSVVWACSYKAPASGPDTRHTAIGLDPHFRATASSQHPLVICRDLTLLTSVILNLEVACMSFEQNNLCHNKVSQILMSKFPYSNRNSPVLEDVDYFY